MEKYYTFSGSANDIEEIIKNQFNAEISHQITENIIKYCDIRDGISRKKVDDENFTANLWFNNNFYNIKIRKISLALLIGITAVCVEQKFKTIEPLLEYLGIAGMFVDLSFSNIADIVTKIENEYICVFMKIKESAKQNNNYFFKSDIERKFAEKRDCWYNDLFGCNFYVGDNCTFLQKTSVSAVLDMLEKINIIKNILEDKYELCRW